MSGGLIRSALIALEKPGAFAPSGALAELLRELNIGKWSKNKVRLGNQGRADLEAYLESEHGIPPGTRAGAWDGLTRSEATALGTNEKMTRRAVRADRVAVKTFAGGTLLCGENAYALPPRISFDASSRDAPLFKNTKIVLVENWEAFECIDLLSFPVPPGLEDAILVFRGDKGSYPTSAAKAFLESSNKPVHVFGDPDPAGLMIALKTCNFSGLVLPAIESLEEMLKCGRGDRNRYRAQLQNAEQTLESSTHPQVSAYWNLVKRFGRAIPQEEFIIDQNALKPS